MTVYFKKRNDIEGLGIQFPTYHITHFDTLGRPTFFEGYDRDDGTIEIMRPFTYKGGRVPSIDVDYLTKEEMINICVATAKS